MRQNREDKNFQWSVFLGAMIILGGFFLSAALASEKGRDAFDSQRQEEGVTFRLRGAGLKRIFFVKVFTAGLYLGEGILATQALTDVPKKLEVLYFQPVSATELAKETRRRIRINVGEREYQRLKPRIDRMDKYFVNIKPGDRYALTYTPAAGTRFTYNDGHVGAIEGADFAKGLFAVWVGPKPIDRRLKAQLLGLDKEGSNGGDQKGGGVNP